MSRLVVVALLSSVLLVPRGQAQADQQQTALDMRSAVQLALENNPQFASALAFSEMVQAQADQAASALHPSVSAEGGYSYLSKETVFGTTPVWERDTVVLRVALQQLLYSGGQVQASIDRARYGHTAAVHGSGAAKAEVIAAAATAYFRARQAQEATGVARASVKSLEAGLDAARKLHESGLVTKSDVLRAEVAVSSARQSLIAAENGHATALAALRTALGLERDAEIGLGADASDAVADLPGETPAERPEISAANASVRAAEAAVKAARAGRLPTVAIAADYFSQPTGSEFPRLSGTFQAGVVARFNVMDGGLTRAGISESDAAVRKAREDLASQMRRVELEQQSAKLNLASAVARLEATASQVQYAEESFRVLEAGYREGITPFTDVLSGEAALTAARFSRLAATYDVKIARVDLLRAFGHTDVLTRQRRDAK